ncbi:hypothetical protein BHE74_00051431 [Ensete ventricosum]|nr:hypothetical protein BHE74_00051431 [Ensete ventricosum]
MSVSVRTSWPHNKLSGLGAALFLPSWGRRLLDAHPGRYWKLFNDLGHSPPTLGASNNAMRVSVIIGGTESPGQDDPNVRTLTDSKLGVISIGDQPPWNSSRLYRSLSRTHPSSPGPGQDDPNVRTLTDSKLGVISIGDQPPWNSTGVPPSLVFYIMAEK